MVELEARRTFERTKVLIADLGRYSSDGCDEVELQAKYNSIMTHLRSVGHIFLYEDCVEEPLKSELSKRWPRWQEANVLKNFIKTTRDALLKHGGEGLNLRGDPNISIGVKADPGMPGGNTPYLHFDPERLTDTQGRLVMPLLREAVGFWDACLREIEAVAPH